MKKTYTVHGGSLGNDGSINAGYFTRKRDAVLVAYSASLVEKGPMCVMVSDKFGTRPHWTINWQQVSVEKGHVIVNGRDLK